MRETVKTYTEELTDFSKISGLRKTKFIHAINLVYILTAQTKINLN